MALATTAAQPETALGDQSDRILLWAAAAFTTVVLLHNSDHARRGTDLLNRDVFWLGTSSIAIEIAVVVLVCQRHRLAPLIATATGYSLAVGYVVVHFLPARGWISDSFVSATDVSPLSWIAATLEVIAALALGTAGLIAMRRRGGLESATIPRREQLPLAGALTHPLVVVMVGGQVVLLAVSAAQIVS
jgi:hypothetical protein